MKRSEEVYRELLWQRLEHSGNEFTQASLAKKLGMSLSVVNRSLSPLHAMNAVSKRARGFIITDAKKLLYYWASMRNIERDIIYRTRSDKAVRMIESDMPHNALYAAYSGYRFLCTDVPADYSEVYVYADDANEIQGRFPSAAGPPNVIVLKRDSNLKRMTLGQMYADLWNLREWYAKDFLTALEARIDGLLE